MLIEDRKINTRYKFEYSKSSFQTRNSISLFVFLRKPLQKQLETGHLVSAQMARRGVTAQRALSTVTPPQRRMDSLRYATSAVGALFTKGRKRWSVTLFIERTTCFREQLPRCVWEAEGGADARAGGRATAPPSSPRCLSATTPPPPPRGGNSQGPCQEPEHGRTDGRRIYAAGGAR